MSVLRSEFDEQRIATAYDFVKQGKLSTEGYQLDIRPPMGANYFRLDKAAVIWADPSFDNVSSGKNVKSSGKDEGLDDGKNDDVKYGGGSTEGVALTDTLMMNTRVAYQDLSSIMQGITNLEVDRWKMIDDGKVHVEWGSGEPMALTPITVYDTDSALTGVNTFINVANENFMTNDAETLTIVDQSIALTDREGPLESQWNITGFCSSTPLGRIWSAPDDRDTDWVKYPYTKGQPFMLCKSGSFTTAEGELTRWYFIYWDLQQGSASTDTWVQSEKIYTGEPPPSLPGWASDHGIRGLGVMWDDDEDNAKWQDSLDDPDSSTAWGGWLGENWFETSGFCPPGQLQIIVEDPDPTPTPTPTPSAVSGAGPGEITFMGESIATLLPGFNDQLAKIWRPVAHSTCISLYAKPMTGWTPTPNELKNWAKNCKSAPIIVEWALKN